jgi:hypothetical protein
MKLNAIKKATGGKRKSTSDINTLAREVAAEAKARKVQWYHIYVTKEGQSKKRRKN